MYVRRLLLIICVVIAASVSAAQPGTSDASPRAELAQPITSSSPTPLAGFGTALAIVNGDPEFPLYVGVPNPGGMGKVERFFFSGSGWVADGCMLTPQTNQNGSAFGAAVAADGADSHIVLVGEPGFDHNSGAGTFTRQGRVTVFVGSGTCPTAVTTLHPPVDGNDQSFGHSVSVAVNGSEVVAVIGAPGHFASSGAAYVFFSPNGGQTWYPQVNLSPSTEMGGMKFGWDVAVDGLDGTPVIAVGATGDGDGKVHLFRRSGSTWPADGVLIASTSPGNDFGYAVDVSVSSGETLVGAACPSCTNGRVELFRRISAASYVSEYFVSGIQSGFGTDVAVEHQPSPAAGEPNAWLSAGTASFFIGRWARTFNGSKWEWDDSGVFVFGASPTAVALGVTAGRSAAVVTTQPNAAAGSKTGAGVGWATFPDDARFELLDNGDFDRPLNDPAVQKWKVVNGSGDKRKCTDADGCAFMFKGSSGEKSRIDQKVKVENFQFDGSDVLSLSANFKPAGANPQLKLKIKVVFSNGEKHKDAQSVASAADWTTVSLAPVHLACRTPSKIIVQVTHSSAKGKSWVDDLSLQAESQGGAACRTTPALAAPALPPPPAMK